MSDVPPAVLGHGNWKEFNLPFDIVYRDIVYRAAAEWKQVLTGVDRPWLCWNVSARWCVLQQRLVREAGWTPVVGFDPRAGVPPIEPGGILIDFNRHFQFPVMFFMFPLEFAFLFAPRLAFWHADLLCRASRMRELAEVFQELKDGEMAAVLDTGGRRYTLAFRRHRFWELAGCITAAASLDQFQKGAGWWRQFAHHPNCPDDAERARRLKYGDDFGFGAMYWKRRYGGKVVSIASRPIQEGHCTSIAKTDYKRVGPEGDTRNMPAELDLNYDLEQVARRLGIAHLL
ncbi:MAG TPA: hypothetical protein VIY49_32545 [Bryobacteraceae bacterium]